MATKRNPMKQDPSNTAPADASPPESPKPYLEIAPKRRHRRGTVGVEVDRWREDLVKM